MGKRRVLGPSAWMLGATGLAIGVFAAYLVKQGNPGNMGLCIACFLRDISSFFGGEAMKMNGFAYIRPEIVGMMLGATVAAISFREFKARGGSGSVYRFVLGFIFMVSALIFLGCPVRAWLRLGGGDLNAAVGIAGLVVGIFVGTVFLRRGYIVGRVKKLAKPLGFVMAAIAVILLVLALVTFYSGAAPGGFSTVAKGAKKTAEGVVFTAEKVISPADASMVDGAIVGADGAVVASPDSVAAAAGVPGGSRAPLYLSLVAGLAIGVAAQRSRFCSVGGIRDSILIKRYDLLVGVAGLVIGVAVMNMVFGQFNLGFEGQPAAHTNFLGNFLPMVLVGLTAVFMGGCPLRQVIMASEGDLDAVAAILGMMLGAVASHALSLASTGAGPASGAWVAMGAMAAVTLGIGFMRTQKA
ncbi:MAG: YedE-related selenium metabolism membrane protein [Coriobacteriia bacterium]|nr:YedE-related selenium metabolism membrane protein [Coriobacteriia bacterium]MBN2821767.1 YedE-related selenium metabolism membrane protein [Coriobacteriia bacterium]